MAFTDYIANALGYKSGTEVLAKLGQKEVNKVSILPQF